MNSRLSFAMPLVGLLLTAMLFSPLTTLAEEPKLFIPDKALCARMLRFGTQAYVRGKYLDAKEYFRRAVKADPGSSVAWRYYDQAVIFALAEKVEKNAELILPDTSTPPPSPPIPAPAQEKTTFKIVDDEGC